MNCIFILSYVFKQLIAPLGRVKFDVHICAHSKPTVLYLEPLRLNRSSYILVQNDKNQPNKLNEVL